MTLRDKRSQIDRIDERLLLLLSERARASAQIARLKIKAGQSVYAPDREQEVLRRVIGRNRGPLSAKAVTAIYREIMSASLALQQTLTVAYMGPEASFSHLAARKRFGSQVNFLVCGSISDVFASVERGGAEYGVVPIENSVEGAVTHTLDMFFDSSLQICAQVILDVAHNLLAKCSRSAVRRIYSNPQVFGQCRRWLLENLPDAELIEVSSTTRAAQLAAKERGAAAIASVLAASVYGLRILERDIEDSPHNQTRFLVIGKTIVAPTGRDKTSLLFSIKDKVGALHEMLVPFKKQGLNLTKIESRPSKRRAWEYYFFVDISGHRDEPRLRRALAALEPRCGFLKVLGSYPVGE